MKLEVFLDRVLIRRTKAKEQTEAGLYIPEAAREAPWSGDVLDVGPDVSHCQIGDQVLFSRYAGTIIDLDEEKLYLLKEDEIFGRLVES